MALQDTDLLLVERGGVKYRMTADQLADFLGAVKDVTAADIADRDSKTGVEVGYRVFVVDASADPDVDSGWAVYRVASLAPLLFNKIQEQESLDVAVAVDLGYVASASSGTVTNSAGSDSVIPSVSATLAGLATPAMFSAAHVGATAKDTPTTNPITVDADQKLGLSIGQLLALP